VAHVAGTEAAEAALLKALYDEHAAILWRYAMRLTGDASRAEDVVQETLLRAWQHPEVMDDPERSPRAWLFTVARNMIIDERRSPRFRMTASSLDDSSTPIALWRAGTPTHAARDGGDTVTTLRPTPMLIAPKANWCKAISVEPSPCCFPSARPSAVCTR
jgi:RNA polymerase sigma factor (sigma-70 family)